MGAFPPPKKCLFITPIDTTQDVIVLSHEWIIVYNGSTWVKPTARITVRGNDGSIFKIDLEVFLNNDIRLFHFERFFSREQYCWEYIRRKTTFVDIFFKIMTGFHAVGNIFENINEQLLYYGLDPKDFNSNQKDRIRCMEEVWISYMAIEFIVDYRGGPFGVISGDKQFKVM